MTNWAVALAIAVVLALPIAWRARQRRFDPFEPLTLFAVAWAVMFVVRPTTLLITGERFFWDVDIRPTLTRALVLALLGAVSFVVGYELRLGRKLASRLPEPRPVDTRIAVVGALVTAVTGAVALAAFLPVGEPERALRVLLGGRSPELGAILGQSSSYVVTASLLFVPAAVVLTALALRDRTPQLAIGAVLLMLLALLRIAPSGARIVLLPFLGGILVLFYVMRGRRPRMVLLGALTILALLGSYFALHVRDPTDDLTLRGAAEQLTTRPHAVFDPVLRSSDAEMVVALSAALTVIPDELSYRWGNATVGNLATRPVPREWWPGKPLPPGETVVSTIWPELYPALNPAFSPLLNYYWDLGLVGVFVGMATFGLFARTLYEWFLRYRTSLAAQLVFSTGLWFVVIGARNDPVDTIALGAFIVGPIIAIVTVAGKRKPADVSIAPRA